MQVANYAQLYQLMLGTQFAIATVVSAPSACAQGIHCRVSSRCSGFDWSKLMHLLEDVNSIDNHHWYQNKQHIACRRAIDGGGICALLRAHEVFPARALRVYFGIL